MTKTTTEMRMYIRGNPLATFVSLKLPAGCDEEEARKACEVLGLTAYRHASDAPGWVRIYAPPEDGQGC